jgi:hypothetical protein
VVSFGGQVGRPGAHSGTGLLAVADWWLARGLAVEEETEAAAAPARTRVRAKMRMTSFMIGNLFGIELTGRISPVTLKC